MQAWHWRGRAGKVDVDTPTAIRDVTTATASVLHREEWRRVRLAALRGGNQARGQFVLAHGGRGAARFSRRDSSCRLLRDLAVSTGRRTEKPRFDINPALGSPTAEAWLADVIRLASE